MKTALTIIFSLALIISIRGQIYKKIEIKLNGPSDIELLNKSGIDLEGGISLKEMKARLYVSEAELRKVNMLGLSYNILIEDWNKYYNTLHTLTEPEINQILEENKNQYGVTGFGYGSMGGFYTYDEVNAQLDSMHARFPDLITQKQSIGMTAGGRPIYMVRITNSSITLPKQQASYNAMHHAREPMGMECLIYFMYYLLENYGTNSSVKYIVDNRELYFVPVCNPDGYEYNRSTNPSGGGFWRKNRRNNGDGTFGVDLNRNYGPDAYWNSPNGGSSTTTSDETYRGTAPFSENETTAIKNYYATHNFKNSISYHTYGNDLIYPYSALAHETADSLFFREYSRDITGYNGYIYGTDMQTVGYSTRGSSDDYFYDGDTVLNGGKIFAMTPEVGTDFWPPQSEIMPDVQINLLPNLYWAWFAGDFATLKAINFDRVYFKAGDTASIRPTIRNKGLATAKNLTFEAASLSSYVTFLNSSQILDSISSRTERVFTNPMKFIISPSAPNAQKVNITFTTKIGGIIVAVDTINFTIGIPTFIFADTTNSPSNLWTIAAAPSGSPKWDSTSADYHSAPNSFTDSKAGNYVSNATVTMTSTNAINLSGYSNPNLSFWTKWEIETLYDCGLVQISTNSGSTWTALKGTLTKAASGIGRQIPAGMQVYDGTHYYWTQEIIDLSSYAGQQIKLRFALWTDGGAERDGWYVDDISVYYYGNLPVELNSFSAKAENGNILLNWKTATEINNLGFEVQRSKELNSLYSGWQTLGFVKGGGTSVTSSLYSFTDRSPLSGKQYYRIKQVDENGTFTVYSPVEANNISSINFSLDQNYPNPFNPSTVIKYTMPSPEIVTIKLYNVLGSEVATLLNEYKEAGIYSLNFSSNELNNKIGSGVYFYTIRAGHYTQTRKMVILK
jgi:carboxypeptidase T